MQQLGGMAGFTNALTGQIAVSQAGLPGGLQVIVMFLNTLLVAMVIFSADG